MQCNDQIRREQLKESKSLAQKWKQDNEKYFSTQEIVSRAVAVYGYS